MVKSNARNGEVTIDEARRALCWHFQKWGETGVSNVKVRINRSAGTPTSVWTYGRVENEWRRQPEAIDGLQYAGLIADELERLAATPHSRECDVTCHEFGDRSEFDVRFHQDDIAEHQGEHLFSYLFGILFYERHATPKMRRQSIRRGPKQQLARF